MDLTAAAQDAGAPGSVVGIGASAGGIDALIRILRTLPTEFAAPICIVLHLPSSGHSLLAAILGRQSRLAVAEARDGDLLRPGRVYVAPNDRHLIVAGDRIQLARGPKENGVRPAVDVLLRTLAATRGPRSIAVVLSGALADGSAGAVAVQQAGGVVIVQEPTDATVASMPESAIRAVGDAADVLVATDIGPALARLVETERIHEDAGVVVGVENPLSEVAE